MSDFLTLPSGPVTLENVTIPACFQEKDGDFLNGTISIANGKIADRQATVIDMGGTMLLPAFVDMHTHLDKGHIWSRTANPDGTFMGALNAVTEDRTTHWSADDVRQRMDFALRCAFAHGTRAIRTHLDSAPPQDQISWRVFQEIRSEWAGRIELQASSLVGCERFASHETFDETADLVAKSNGILGMATYQTNDFPNQLDDFIRLASDRGLSIDLHVDETMDPSSETLRQIAQTILDTRFDAPVTVGHCCALSTQDNARALDTLDLVAKAGINVVSLPMCNLYLQDRHQNRTPRNRGITLVHEMKARGINVSFASDNTRDPFYAYGDLDMVEVMREATRIGHLDHSSTDWPLAFSTSPARACGFSQPSLKIGAPADLILFKARSWTEFFARPQSDRIVLRNGIQIDRTLPDYSELDPLMRLS